MLQKYKHFIHDLLKYGENTPTWDYFRNEQLSADGTSEYLLLIQSVCGPYSIPEIVLECDNVIPIIMYDADDNGFKIQYEATTTPIMIYDTDTWLDSLLVFWHDTPESTDAELEQLAKGFIYHAVNSYFTGNTEPYEVSYIVDAEVAE